jgi:hypothetical protein
MRKYCLQCAMPFDSLRARICSDECRDDRKRERDKSPNTKFTILKRILEAEKIYPRDDRLIYSLNFYAALLAWDECQWCSGPLPQAGISLDRVDNAIGHYSWNVIPACGFCNQIRSDALTFDQMVLLRDGLVEIRRRRESKK